jgi:hypothetical protein
MKSQDLTLDAGINNTVVAGETDTNCSCDTYEESENIGLFGNIFSIISLMLLTTLYISYLFRREEKLDNFKYIK